MNYDYGGVMEVDDESIRIKNDQFMFKKLLLL
jgi:hypothetical protein